MTRGGNLFGNGGNFGLFESTITLLYENDYLLENIDGWSSFLAFIPFGDSPE
jgi:hypothetical protein